MVTQPPTCSSASADIAPGWRGSQEGDVSHCWGRPQGPAGRKCQSLGPLSGPIQLRTQSGGDSAVSESWLGDGPMGLVCLPPPGRLASRVGPKPHRPA